MCVVVAKYFKDIGWILVKNRDRPYKPLIHIKQSFKDDVERLYIYDTDTKYTEGLNEFGTCIISSTFSVKDEQEIQQIASSDVGSLDGKKIRNALLEKTIDKSIKKLIELEATGCTLICNKNECYVLEGYFPSKVVDPDEEHLANKGDEISRIGKKIIIHDMSNYTYKLQKIKKDEFVVRTNHGVLCPTAGYTKELAKELNDDKMNVSSESSFARREKVLSLIKNAKDPEGLLEVLSNKDDKNEQLNPLRTTERHGKYVMVTTGQLILNPGELTLSYRNIWSDVQFDHNKLDHPSKKTSFEVVSSKKLLSLKEWIEQKII